MQYFWIANQFKLDDNLNKDSKITVKTNNNNMQWMFWMLHYNHDQFSPIMAGKEWRLWTGRQASSCHITYQYLDKKPEVSTHKVCLGFLFTLIWLWMTGTTYANHFYIQSSLQSVYLPAAPHTDNLFFLSPLHSISSVPCGSSSRTALISQLVFITVLDYCDLQEKSIPQSGFQ